MVLREGGKEGGRGREGGCDLDKGAKERSRQIGQPKACNNSIDESKPETK